jgi:glycogen debranching enzyme
MLPQPHLFDLVSCVAAPSLVLSRDDGQIRAGGVEGWLRDDRRLLSLLRVLVDGEEPLGLRAESDGARAASFRGIVRAAGDSTHDPTVFVDRRRVLGHRDLTEVLTLSSSARREVELTVTVEAAADFARTAEVRAGETTDAVTAEASGEGLRWSQDGTRVELRSDPAPSTVDGAARTGVMAWTVTLAPGESVSLWLHAAVDTPGPPLFRGAHSAPWSRPVVTCPDPRVALALHRGLADLEGLLLCDPAEDDVFAAAGTPWFLTLFGRDSLWTARMLLPTGTDLAMSTLRVLARRQGEHEDPVTEEQPGRILHEVRTEALTLGGMTIPPLYYGTVDATPLFVILLAEAWRWGADPKQVRRLLPAAQRCLDWVEQQTGDEFLRYVDRTGTGLSNQGWKDSDDSIQWADGALAAPPIALSEVQAYAYQAAVLGADLLDAFGSPDGPRRRAWAESLAERFRAAFWVDDPAGPYPAVALDRDGRAVDSVASNMGHLLGTGLLTPEEEGLVARRLASEAMDSGFGLRTLTAESPAFSRLSYHGGSVWPHDTAIAVMGLARAGFGTEAQSLLEGLLRAAPAFGFRLPELYGGDSARDREAPMPYPAACRPQAWAAAAPVAALTALLGLHVDVPAGQVSVRPLVTTPPAPLSVTGLRLGAHDLDVHLDHDGHVEASTSHPDVAVVAARGERA